MMATKIRIDALMMTETCADDSRTTATETRSAVAGGLTTTAVEMRSGRRRLDKVRCMRCWRLGEGDELYAADGSSTTQTRCGRLRLDNADEIRPIAARRHR
jgi:hypothetical protein